MKKLKFEIEDVIEHKGTKSRYRIKKFTLETAIMKNLDPKARIQNRQIMLDQLNRYKLIGGNVTDPNIIGQINRIEAAVKFMREDITKIRDDMATLRGNNQRSLEHMHKKIDVAGGIVEKLNESLRNDLGVGN